MLQITAATRNRAKVRELQQLLDGAAEVQPLHHDISPETIITADLEAGESCDQIATSKAIFWSTAIQSGEFVVATDGGLLVPALGTRWTPTRTRRFAGDDSSDFDRARTLLQLAAGLEGREREIGWIEAVAIAQHGEVVATWCAESEPGLLSEEIDDATLRTSSGFWIDSLWRYPRFGNRLKRELTREEFNSRQDHWSELRTPIREWLMQASGE